MQDSTFLFHAFVYLAAAVIAVPISKRLGLGAVLGYIIAGILIGPYGLSFIQEEGSDVMHFAEFGVVIMLFLIGLELEPKRLWRLRTAILGLGGFQMILSAAILGSIGLALGLPWQSALAIGLILALSSTAVGTQTLSEKRLLSSIGGENAFSVLLFQDIAVIPILAIFPILVITETAQAVENHKNHNAHGEAEWLMGLPTWSQTLVVFGIVAAIILVGLFIMRPLFRFIAKTKIREIFTAAALMLIVGIALVMIKVGLSPALGTFLAGVVLGGSEYRHELESEIEPFKGLLLGLFFLAVGAGIDFSLVIAKPEVIGFLLGILLLSKLIILLILGKIAKMRLGQNLLFSVTLASGGEFAFVLFSAAGGYHIIHSELINILILVVALSMALSPVLFLLWEKIVNPYLSKKDDKKSSRSHDEINEEGSVIIAGFGSFGNIVGRLLRANGIGPTVLDLDSDKVNLLRKIGLPVFFGDAARPDLLLSAGAATAKVIILATDDHESHLRIISMVQKHFPNLKILARAKGRPEAYDLLDAGAHQVYRETLDTSLHVGIDTLKHLGFSPHVALRASRTFKKHDEASLDELKTMRSNQKHYLSRTKEIITDLENLLQSEFKQRDISTDAAWDTTTRRKAAIENSKKKPLPSPAKP